MAATSRPRSLALLHSSHRTSVEACPPVSDEPVIIGQGRRECLRWAVGAVVAAGLAGCAGVTQWEPLKVSVVSIETAPSQGFELRFNIKLRVQNPNDFSLEYNGLAVELEINGKATATGVSADKGTLPRFGEAIIELPVSVSALAALKQIVKMAEGKVGEDGLPYVLTGKVNTPWLGAVRFSHTGVLTLPH